MAEKSKILVIGGTGYIGKYIVKQSVKSGHQTFALVRETTASENPQKSALIESFKTLGVVLIYGDICDHNNLVKAIKEVDVVISTLGLEQIAEQSKIVAAIKEAGNVKRFLPSEFGTDVDRVHPVEPAGKIFRDKANIRRALEAEGIPYTIVLSYGFAGFFLPNLGQPGLKAPPRDKVVILGDGNVKQLFVDEDDIATYTIKAVDDPRTLNKSLKMRPPSNILTFNELVSLWEKKIGNTLERVYTSEDQLLKKIQESPYRVSLVLSICHSTFVKGDVSIIETDPSSCVDATELYPEVKYTTAEDYLDRYV